MTQQLSAGLYLIATPIGAARDITLRALDILASADVLAAEDTRTLRHLMDIHGIALAGRRITSYHEHSAPKVRDALIAAMVEGKSVAYASEAGTPLVADPGFALVRAAHEAGVPVIAAPGASAVLTALTVAGLPTDRFLFCGFPPARQTERRRWLAEALAVPATTVFYESPRRVRELFADLVHVAGEDRKAAVCRELTKRFEEVRRGTVGELAGELRDVEPRGEYVVLVDRGAPEGAGIDLETELKRAMQTMSLKDAASAVAEATGQPRRRVYQQALKMAGGSK